MSDAGRKDFTDKLKDGAQPNESKSTLDRVGDSLSGAYDKAARDLVPDQNKSTSQSLADKASREKDSHGAGEGIGSKIQNALGMGDKTH